MARFPLLLLPFITMYSVSCTSQPAAPELKTNENNKTLLWEVSGGGLQQPSYFLGTMHVLCPEDGGVSPQLTKVLDHVKAIYLEVDLDDMMQMLGAMKAMNMRNDTSLADLLTPDELEKVKTYFDGKLPLPFAMMQRYKPMLLSGMIAEQLMPCSAGKGMEMILLQEAKKRSLSIEGLETMAYQAGLFDSIPYGDQAKELVKAIDSMGTQKESIGEMIQYYKEQDIDKLGELTMTEEAGMVEYLDLLLYNRNRNWAEKFADITAGGSFLFAVGAGHLPGDQGVINLLRQKGYTLRPLQNNMEAKANSKSL